MTYIWEVKPRSPYGRTTGRKQLNRYVQKNQERGIPTERGYALETLKQVTIGDEVLYLTYENGVIYYSLSDSEDYKPQNIKHDYVDTKGTLKKFKDMIREEIRKRSMNKNKAQEKEGKIISFPNVEVPDAAAAFGLGLLAGAGLWAFGSHGNDRQTQYAR